MPTVADIMTTDILTLGPDMSLRTAVEALGNERVTGAPVVVNGRLVGVVSASDIVEFQGANPAMERPGREDEDLREELGGPPRSDEDAQENPSSFFVDYWGDSESDLYQRFEGEEQRSWDLLAKYTVGEIMTRKVLTVRPVTPLKEAAGIMSNQGIHRLLVTENDTLVGIITTSDLVRAIADGTLNGEDA
ncbi:MAG: CBS domain-containing protein [Gemmatimonadales bacterium]|nr:MAG: CBS domain-containing protein [Gemmatimonadales bacterium]